MTPTIDPAKPWVNGLCIQGSHEGKPKKYYTGQDMPACKGQYGGGTSHAFGKVSICTCKCHNVYRMAREEFGVDLLSPLSPASGLQPSSVPVAGSLPVPPSVDTHASGDSLAIPVVPTFTPTPAGYRPAGTLEKQLDHWLRILVSIGGNTVLTPRYIADFIDAENPPSTGAICAALERWVKLGYATIAYKPTRFLDFTEEGKSTGLEAMQRFAKRQKKMRTATQKRGF